MLQFRMFGIDAQMTTEILQEMVAPFFDLKDGATTFHQGSAVTWLLM